MFFEQTVTRCETDVFLQKSHNIDDGDGFLHCDAGTPSSLD